MIDINCDNILKVVIQQFGLMSSFLFAKYDQSVHSKLSMNRAMYIYRCAQLDYQFDELQNRKVKMKNSIQLKDKIYRIKLHQQYEIGEDHKLYKNIKNLYILFNQKERKRKQKQRTTIPYTNFPTFEFLLMGQVPGNNKCTICHFQFEDVEDYQYELVMDDKSDIISLACNHLIHKSCFRTLKGERQWIKCPVCSSIYGMMIGDQPPGKMSSHIDSNTHCDGFPDIGTIIILYQMAAGKRGNIHFPGTQRLAYLPDNTEGNQVLGLLKEAFSRNLIFTIGRSITTGRDNQIVWNGIHHQTNTHGGPAYFGYPDPTYFKRVKQQLAAKGIY